MRAKSGYSCQILYYTFIHTSTYTCLKLAVCWVTQEKREERLQTEANRELNSPAAVQAALVIPWKAWAEDDAAEVCHGAATLSWGRPTKEKEHVTSPWSSSVGKQRKTMTRGLHIQGGQRALCLCVSESFSTRINVTYVVHVYPTHS